MDWSLNAMLLAGLLVGFNTRATHDARWVPSAVHNIFQAPVCKSLSPAPAHHAFQNCLPAFASLDC